MKCISNSLADVKTEALFIVRITHLSDAVVLVPNHQQLGISLSSPVQDQTLEITLEGDKTETKNKLEENPQAGYLRLPSHNND